MTALQEQGHSWLAGERNIYGNSPLGLQVAHLLKMLHSAELALIEDFQTAYEAGMDNRGF